MRYPRLSLVSWLFPYQWRSPCMFWHVLCLACRYLIFLPIYELTAMKQPTNLLHLPKTTRNTCKVANKLITVASREINLQSKHDLIGHVAKVKAATSTHSMADVLPFFFSLFTSHTYRANGNLRNLNITHISFHINVPFKFRKGVVPYHFCMVFNVYSL